MSNDKLAATGLPEYLAELEATIARVRNELDSGAIWSDCGWVVEVDDLRRALDGDA